MPNREQLNRYLQQRQVAGEPAGFRIDEPEESPDRDRKAYLENLVQRRQASSQQPEVRRLGLEVNS